MISGFQTVTVKSATLGAPDRKGIQATSYVSQTWPGCSLQPTEVREDVTDIDYEITKYRLFGPPTAVGLKVKTTDLIVDANNITYRVIGTKLLPSRRGVVHHVEAMLEAPSGLNTVPAPGG